MAMWLRCDVEVMSISSPYFCVSKSPGPFSKRDSQFFLQVSFAKSGLLCKRGQTIEGAYTHICSVSLCFYYLSPPPSPFFPTTQNVCTCIHMHSYAFICIHDVLMHLCVRIPQSTCRNTRPFIFIFHHIHAYAVLEYWCIHMCAQHRAPPEASDHVCFYAFICIHMHS